MWEKWAPLIRKKAGLGVIDQQLKPDYYDKQYKFYDVVVVGGGPAGMQAAIDAGIGNCEVLLVDENPILGGSLNYTRLDAKEVLSQQIREELVTKIQTNSNITVMTNAVCNGWFADNSLDLEFTLAVVAQGTKSTHPLVAPVAVPVAHHVQAGLHRRPRRTHAAYHVRVGDDGVNEKRDQRV